MNIETLTSEKRLAMYYDWVNNFLSVRAFADYYGITYGEAFVLINQERAKQA